MAGFLLTRLMATMLPVLLIGQIQHVSAANSVIFKNNCPYPLYYWVVGPAPHPAPHDQDRQIVPAHSTSNHGMVYYPKGGISLKINDVPYYEDQWNIVQVEYTNTPGSTKYSYDLSMINCGAGGAYGDKDRCPFFYSGTKFYATEAPTDERGHCPSLYCPAGTLCDGKGVYMQHGFWEGEPTHHCTVGSDIVFETCADGVGDVPRSEWTVPSVPVQPAPVQPPYVEQPAAVQPVPVQPGSTKTTFVNPTARSTTTREASYTTTPARSIESSFSTSPVPPTSTTRTPTRSSLIFGPTSATSPVAFPCQHGLYYWDGECVNWAPGDLFVDEFGDPYPGFEEVVEAGREYQDSLFIDELGNPYPGFEHVHGGLQKRRTESIVEQVGVEANSQRGV